jgi:hypothetical protein
MIKGILIVNNHGKPRIVKFYEHVVRPARLLRSDWRRMAS